MTQYAIAMAARGVIATTASAWGLARKRRGLSLIGLALLAACSASLPPIDAEKVPPTPPAYKEGSFTVAPPAESQPRGEWWKAFADPLLDDLIARADRGNTSIRIAA